ncbi:hypothetical protein UlMin_016897 [Ulmus minor]
MGKCSVDEAFYFKGCLDEFSSICSKLDARIRSFWWGALLAKWGWNLLTNATSLCVSVLCSRYIQYDRFFDIPKKIGDSPFWKAILDIKNLLADGACYVMGDGNSIDPWKDPWITIPLNPKPDYWVWTPSANGKFSVRSMYLHSNRHRFSPSAFARKEDWLKIWNHKLLLPRHKLNWWHFVSNCFRTRDKLSYLFAIDDTSYPICASAPENMIHLLFFCDLSRHIWLASPWNIRTKALNCSNSLDGLKFLWSMEDNNLAASPVLDAAAHSSCYWHPPPSGWIKVNSNATIGEDVAVIACVARDDRGSILCCKSRRLDSSHPLFAEGLVVELAIEMACNAGWHAVVFESDSKSFVEASL